jgi:hypothetical protein
MTGRCDATVFSLGPLATSAAKSDLLDYFIGAREKRLWHF